MLTRARWLPLVLIAALVAAWFALGLHRTLSWESLAAHQSEARTLIAARPLLAAAAYCLGYAGLVALSLPVGGLLTLAGGWLFGAATGGALAMLGGSCGALALFVLARGALAPALAARAGPMATALREGLQRDGFSFLLAIRLIPVVPFWIGNLAPALAGMRAGPFMAATVLGILPTTFVLASVGAGLGDALASGAQPDLSVLASRPVLLPLLALSALSLAPVAWRRWRPARRRKQLPSA